MEATGAHVRSIFRLTILASLFASVSLLSQTGDDAHMTDAAAALYQRSAFAHGYLHGYEQGFHLADLDIQLGHLLPGVKAHHDERPDSHYRAAYGDKTLFHQGFKLGMRAGYADSISGHEFRAISGLRKAADGLAASAASKHFDRAFYEGFLSGERQGVADPHLLTDFAPVSSACLQQHAKTGEQYCDGFARGFQLGYGDGRAEFLAGDKGVQTAENSKIH